MSDNTPNNENESPVEAEATSVPDAAETVAPSYEAPSYEAPSYEAAAAPAAPTYGAPEAPAAPAYGAPAYPAPPAQSGYNAAPAYPSNAYGGQAYAPPAPNNTLAIVSLIAGIAGLTLLPGIGSIVAVITGHMALSKIKTSGENGRGLAIGGLITGYIGLALGLLSLIIIIGMWSFIASSGVYY